MALYVSREEHERTIRFLNGKIDGLKNRLGYSDPDIIGGDYEPAITAGTSAQYWRGDKSWATLNQAAVAGLTTADSPTLAGLTLSGLTASLPVVTDGSKGLASLAYATFKTNLAIAQADITGLTTADSPTFAGLTTSGNIVAKGFTVREYAYHCATSIFSYSDTASHYPLIALYKSHQNTWGLTPTVNGEDIGRIRFNGVNAAATPALVNGGYIRVVQNGAAGSSYVPVDMQFYVSDGASVINALSLTKSGGMHVGGTSDVDDNALRVDGKFGCNGASAQAAYVVGAALSAYGTGAFGFDSDAHASELHAMVVAIRAALIANGIAIAT